MEFGEKLLSIAAQEGLGVYLLGGKPGVAQNAAEKLKIQFPDLDIRGVHDGYFDKSGAENEAIVEGRQHIRSPNSFCMFRRAFTGNMDLRK